MYVKHVLVRTSVHLCIIFTAEHDLKQNPVEQKIVYLILHYSYLFWLEFIAANEP